MSTENFKNRQTAGQEVISEQTTVWISALKHAMEAEELCRRLIALAEANRGEIRHQWLEAAYQMEESSRLLGRSPPAKIRLSA
jgi:hypothetical protein